ncbi:ATP-binding cassette domain-containing protein, partial [Yaniella sp.]|uniref:ATP-binding cassette domain-containing protein n=2 Tax=Yaniella sp. TaxID=2773929 RepID=UPI00264901B6
YKSRTLFKSINLKVFPGEMIAIMGPSGSGKSTLLNILGLLDVPDSGEVLFQGAPAPKPRSRAAVRYRRERLGYLFQNFALIEDATVKQNLEIALAYVPRSDRTAKRIDSVLTTVGLQGVENRRIYSFSGGEQQRIALARLLLKPCDIVLADEPTGSLDNHNRDQILALLKELPEAGKATLIVTHDETVAQACNRVIHLNNCEAFESEMSAG